MPNNDNRVARREAASIRGEMIRSGALVIPAGARVILPTAANGGARRNGVLPEAVHERWTRVVRCTHGKRVEHTDHEGTHTLTVCPSGGFPDWATLRHGKTKSSVLCRVPNQ